MGVGGMAIKLVPGVAAGAPALIKDGGCPRTKQAERAECDRRGGPKLI